MATISNTPRPGYVWDATDNCWYPIGTGPHSHADYITAGSAINPNIVDAKGDIIAATAADTVARLAVGSNDQVLTADSSTATGLKWATPAAGGMTSLASGSIAASITGIDITSISGSYNELWLYLTNYSTTSANTMQLRINGNTNADYNRLTIRAGDTTVLNQTGATAMDITGSINTSQSGQSAIIRFPNYANTTGWKLVDSHTTFDNESSYKNAGMIKATAAIDRITILLNGGAFDSGTYTLYGVK